MTDTSTITLSDSAWTPITIPAGVNWVRSVTIREQGAAASAGWYLRAPTLNNVAALKAPGEEKAFVPKAYFQGGQTIGYGMMVRGSADFSMECEL